MAPFLLLLFLLSEAASDLPVVTVDPGGDVILPCQADDSSISAVKWTKRDLKPDTVFLSSDGHLKPDDQNPSFKDRVDLVDRELKDGDVSLILKNVNINDNGTYECGVKTSDSRHRKRTSNPTKTIGTVRLQVTEPEKKCDSRRKKRDIGCQKGPDRAGASGARGNGGLVAGVVFLVAVAAVVGGLMYKRRRDNRPELPAAAEAGDTSTPLTT